MVEDVSERFLYRQDVVLHQPGVQAAHTAGNIEADAAGRDHAALVGVEGRHAADGKAITPVRIGHGVTGLDDAGQGRDVDGLFVDLVVHGADERFIGVDDRRHAHGAVGFDLPFVIGATFK